LRIALLGYNEYQPRWFEAGYSAAGVAWSEEEQVVRDIHRAQGQGAQVVIPFMHWGWENDATPCQRQRDLARRMIDAGAAAVVGTHPHVTQGTEIYRGKPIIYSLGNFLFNLFDNERNATGWLLRLDLDESGIARWDTLAVAIDERGVPSPKPSILSPCGIRGDSQPRDCSVQIDRVAASRF
jgi:poly-gamma-glutamate synthesis protein (capsule biosynthesis protein)